MPRLLVACLLFGLFVPPAAAFETAAEEAILIDLTAGTVLFEKDADTQIPPASMSKIMTAYMVFKRLKAGDLSMEDTFLVSEKAWRKGGSKMFVEVGDRVAVEDLLRGVIVQSGNDASIVLAEGIAGSEAAFAELMNREAEELGLTNSSFANATGWPDPNHRMSVRDLAKVASVLVQDYPEYYGLYSETEFTWHEIRQSNRNPLLYRNIDADGLKTGHTEEAGYCLTASALRGDRRLVMVVAGLESARQRAEESERLLEWGFREFSAERLFEIGEVVEEAEVWLGEDATVPLVVAEDAVMAVRRDARDDVVVTVSYDGPIPAPVAAGDRLATLTVQVPDMPAREFPLLAGGDVEKLGPIGRLMAGVRHLIFGKL
ncbi:D-alanyl-D-alanine carboxypeptidase family protein [Algihabitans albus]|uniref:D-alanyl-D-alanine carboxypeptidase family protein n=1 Tax=Algihabitans albus TaxID=2164067 RepID=UPI000E5CFD01|nr:D-alanyl-D-alanine carboxypeptidase family protein [Algihabitans albus]